VAKLTFAGPSARDTKNRGANGARLLNCYREPVQSGGSTGYVVKSVPGMGAWITWVTYPNTYFPAIGIVGTEVQMNAPVKFIAATQAGRNIAMLVGPVVRYQTKVDTYDTYTLDFLSGNPVDIFGNIVAGGRYLLATDGRKVVISEEVAGTLTTVLSTLSLGAITTCTSVSYLGGYAILTERGGRKVQWSNLGMTAFPGLNFATAETTGEDLVRGITVSNLFMAFKNHSISFWQVTGGAGADAFAPIVGRDADIGLLGFRLLTDIPDGCAFCSSDGKVMVYMAGGGLSPISVPALEVALETMGPRDMFYYEVRGHGFICVTFERAAAWCYDTALGEWHERGQGVADGPWDARCAAEFEGKWVFGMGDGTVCVASDRLKDVGVPLRRVIVSGILDLGRRFRLAMVEIQTRVGDGRISTAPPAVTTNLFDAAWQGRNYSATGDLPEAEVMVSFSPDGGQTWGPEKERPLGKVGEYQTRVVLRSQGQFRMANMRVALANEIDVPIYSDADVEAV
jgi:hypothetical protein